jgi:hypothetical protein
MMIMEMEKDWALFCFNCVLRDTEDLLFAAQITASTQFCTVYLAYPGTLESPGYAS